ncbi:MAG: hypothetical protein ACXWSD_09010, partial [Bdellovibrionota bacterium]
KPQLLGELKERLNALVDEDDSDDSMKGECMGRHPDDGPSSKCGTHFAGMLRNSLHGITFESGFPKVQLVDTEIASKCNVMAEIQLSPRIGDEVMLSLETECRTPTDGEDALDEDYVGYFKNFEFASMGAVTICDSSASNVLQANLAKLCSAPAAEMLLKHVSATTIPSDLSQAFTTKGGRDRADDRLERAEKELADDMKTAGVGLEGYRHTGTSSKFTKISNPDDRKVAESLTGEKGAFKVASIAVRPDNGIGFDGYRSVRVFFVQPTGGMFGAAKPITSSVRLMELYNGDTGANSPSDLAGSRELCAPVRLQTKAGAKEAPKLHPLIGDRAMVQ